MGTKRGVSRLAVLGLALSAAACAAPRQAPLYQWGAYPGAVYAYLKGSNAELGSQILELEALVRKNAASGAATPPGLHAHLGLLYGKTGDDANAARHLQAEKQLFPESTPYMDYLLKRAAR